jgi:hypothetical protein
MAPQRAEDRARGVRLVERVEVDPGRAVGQQVGALQRRVGDAESATASGWSARSSSSRSSASGIVAPHMLVKRLIWPTLVIGMIPG